MLRKQFAALLLLCALLLTSTPMRAQQVVVVGQQPQAAKPDPNDPVEKIKDEGLNRSQVMQTLSYLTDVIGPRLTNSPQMKRSNEWTRDTLTKWGLQNAHLEAWGPFGRGWSLRRFSAEVVEPQGFPLVAYPKAWSPGTRGVLTAEVVHVDAKTEAELEKFKGQLAGKIVLTNPIREVKAHFEAESTRLNEKELLALANSPEPGAQPAGGRRQMFTPEQAQQFLFNLRKANFLLSENPAMLVDPGRGDGGNLFVQSASVPAPVPENIDLNNMASLMSLFRRGTPVYSKDAPKITPQVVMSVEHYNRVLRMLQAGEKVKMSVNLDVQFHDQDLMGYNTVAEIPGSDPALKEELVMLGGHMDSWHGGTGATDNGAGVAVAMEAVRIIQAAGLKPKRTIRIALWSGEEQGLLGSRAYVKEHFGEIQAPPGTQPGIVMLGQPQGQLVKKPEYDKFSVYFNLDNGTGAVRGVYLQGNEAVRPIFRQWLAPFRELKVGNNTYTATTLSISNTGGTDHLSFDAIGLPGFQFIQDEVEYDTRTHHSTQDVFDRIQADDMKQAAVVMATFVYNAAMRDDKMPRKPAPGNGTQGTR